MANLTDDLVEALRTPAAQEILRQTVVAAIRPELQAWRPDAHRLVDAEEAAAILGRTVGAVRKAAGRGKIPCHHDGRRIRFNVGEIMATAMGEQAYPGPTTLDSERCPPRGRKLSLSQQQGEANDPEESHHD
jgi:Helix-turn-helix domain